MKDNKFLVTFSRSCQATEHDWQLRNTDCLFSENTTLKEIREWYLSKVGTGYKKLDEVRLSEPEQVKGNK